MDTEEAAMVEEPRPSDAMSLWARRTGEWSADDVRLLEAERDDLRGHLAGMQIEWDLLKAENLRLFAELTALREENERPKKALIDGVPPEVLRGQER